MSGQPVRLSPTECTCFRVRGAARRVTQIYSRHLAPTGLKISQFSLLGFVCAEGPIAIGRLSDLLVTDRTTLTRNLSPLLKDGLIERAQSGDRRRHELVATPAGRALFRRALPLWSAAVIHAFHVSRLSAKARVYFSFGPRFSTNAATFSAVLPLKPLSDPTETEYVVDPPALTLRDSGVTATAKSGAGVTTRVALALCVAPPELPLIVNG